jgi:hypothetical protein
VKAIVELKMVHAKRRHETPVINCQKSLNVEANFYTSHRSRSMTEVDEMKNFKILRMRN